MQLIYINKYIFIKNTYFYIVDHKNCNYIIHYIVLFTNVTICMCLSNILQDRIMQRVCDYDAEGRISISIERCFLK